MLSDIFRGIIGEKENGIYKFAFCFAIVRVDKKTDDLVSFFFREERGDLKKLRQFLSQKNLILFCFLIFFENGEIK